MRWHLTVLRVDIVLMKKGKYLLAAEIFYSNPECLFLSIHSTYDNVGGFKGLELGIEIL